jgi:PleD family two-component response regulator
LCIECTLDNARILRDRLHQSFNNAGVSASIGLAQRHPEKGLSAACEEADVRMYEEKRGKKQLLADSNH